MTLPLHHNRGEAYATYDTISTPAWNERTSRQMGLSIATIRVGNGAPYIIAGHSVISARSWGFAAHPKTDRAAIRPNPNRGKGPPISYTDSAPTPQCSRVVPKWAILSRYYGLYGGALIGEGYAISEKSWRNCCHPIDSTDDSLFSHPNRG